MQWDIDGLLVWLITTSISITGLGRSNVEADALSRIDWGKNDQTFPAESIQAIVTAALIGQGKDYIKAIPCSHQAIESFAPACP